MRAFLHCIESHCSRPVLDSSSIPTATLRVMAPVLARQFCKLQAPPFQQAPRSGISQGLVKRPVATPTPSASPAPPTPHSQESKVGDPSICPGPDKRGTWGTWQVHSFLANVPTFILSSLAVIPKNAAGKWDAIVDMSSPHGASVNDNLHRNLTYVAFSSVDDAAHLMHHLGPNTLLAMLDIKEAYRLIPVHPNNWIFQGICWQDSIFVDCQLQFGLASAPAIFSILSEALQWILPLRGVSAVIHYMHQAPRSAALSATKAAVKLGRTGRLNLAARSELAWWGDSLLEQWHGTFVYQFLLLKSPDRHIEIIWLWSLVGTPLVLYAVVQPAGVTGDCHQRTPVQ